MGEEKDQKKERKKLSIKEIGMDKLFIIILVGILLVIFSVSPNTSSKKNTETKSTSDASVPNSEETYEEQIESRLKRILSAMEGVGSVDVIVTLKASEELVVDKNVSSQKSSIDESDSSGGSRNSLDEKNQSDTVIVQNENGDSPYVLQEKAPIVEGIVVIAEGGDKPQIVSEINEALQALFDISSHKIKVLKRKSVE